MASQLAPLPRLGQTDDHFGLLGFGAGFMPAEAPVFSSSLRERVILLANHLVVSTGEPAMSTDTAAIVRALCHTLRHVRDEAPPTPTRFGPMPMMPMFMPTVLSAPAWPSPSSITVWDPPLETSHSLTTLEIGGAPHLARAAVSGYVDQFDSLDEHTALSLPASDMMSTPQGFAHSCVMTSTVAPPATSTLPPGAASLKRRDVDDDYFFGTSFATPTKKAAHGIYFSQLVDGDPVVRSALPPPKSASQLDLAQLASDWRSILGGVGGISEEAVHSSPAKPTLSVAEHEEHVGEDFWHVLEYQLGMEEHVGEDFWHVLEYQLGMALAAER
jgi:hypothetical protein